MQDLPPIYQPKKSSFTRFLYSLFTLFIMLAALPIGVYLVGHQTNFQPKAATSVANNSEEPSFSLEDVRGSQTTSPGVIPVDVIVSSDKDPVNLFVGKISFPPELLEVESVATSSASTDPTEKTRYFTNKWIDSSFDNQKGTISLIAGVPNPGLKTDPNHKYILATLFVKAKNKGEGLISVNEDSTMYKNADNKLLTVKRNEITLNLDELPSPTVLPATASGKPVSKIAKTKEITPFLQLISPQAGDVYSYNSTIPVAWSSSGIGDVTLWLDMNGSILGKIATIPAAQNSFRFNPSDFIAPTFISPENVFSLELSATSDEGNPLFSKVNGPIGIVAKKDMDKSASQSAQLSTRGGDANGDGKIDFTDLSLLLTEFYSTQNLNLGTDLNGDGVVNDLDLYFMKGLLEKNGQIEPEK